MVAVALHGQEVRLVLEAGANEDGARGDRRRHRRAREEVALGARHGQHVDGLLLALELRGGEGGRRRGGLGQRGQARPNVVDGTLEGVALRLEQRLARGLDATRAQRLLVLHAHQLGLPLVAGPLEDVDAGLARREGERAPAKVLRPRPEARVRGLDRVERRQQLPPPRLELGAGQRHRAAGRQSVAAGFELLRLGAAARVARGGRRRLHLVQP